MRATEPVVDYGRLAGLVSGALTAVVGVVVLVQHHAGLSAEANATGGAVVAVGALAAAASPIVAAYRARRLTTSLADPHDAAGQTLAPVGSDPIPDPPGRHEAAD